VREKKIGVRALQDKDQAVLVRFDLARHATEFGVELKSYDVDWWSVYRRSYDLAIAIEPDQFVSFVGHSSFLVVEVLTPEALIDSSSANFDTCGRMILVLELC
jgi:hypothetical protein